MIENIKSGDHRKALVALRDILADHLAIAEPSVSAQIAGRLQAVLNEIAALPGEVNMSTTDQLRAKRDQRRSTTVA